jgi:sialidase-1
VWIKNGSFFPPRRPLATSLFFFWTLVFLSSFTCANQPEASGNTAPTIQAYGPSLPVLRGLEINPFLRLSISVPEGGTTLNLRSLIGRLNREALGDIQRLDLYASQFDQMPSGTPLASFSPEKASFEIPVSLTYTAGLHTLWISVVLKDDAGVDGMVELHIDALTDGNGTRFLVTENASSFVKRKGVALRKGGQEGVDTYRIPGIIATDKGTLIAVYDIRYQNSRDLPGNIDVGMNRSTDGGKTWSPMKIIMDMGAPHENNGIGDPCILFDPKTNKIWVAALWSKGNRSIAGSGPGLTPDETGQYVLVSSSDDGLTWSQPLSITPQVKNPAWKLFFQGPGSGIAMSDGTLVFPSQFWDASGMPYSNIIYSKDHGVSWQCSAAAPKANTTESQVVETTPGTLMLNMRDNRGQFRSVATTTDLGTTWKEHPTSRKDLPDPVCMGSLIKAEVTVNGAKRQVLFFSNPDKEAAPREKITVKTSLDLGESWLSTHSLLVDERNCYGYSSLVLIDQQTLGLLYEGTKDLYFVKIPIKELLP